MADGFAIRVVAGVVLAMFLIVGGDAAGKLLAAQGMPTPFVAWARFAVAAVVLLPLARMGRADWPHLLNPRLWLRAALIAGGITCILRAVSLAPMADVFAAFFVGPIVAFILSAVILKERVTPLRTVLLLLSFAGVLVVVRPGFGMQPGLAWALAAGVLHGSYLVTTRWLAPSFRPMLLLWSQLVIGALILTPFAFDPGETWNAGIASLLLISALGSAAGNLILVRLNRTTPASTIAPLIYSQLIAATVLGWAIFDEVPDLITAVGLVMILATGVGSALAAGRGR